MFELQKTEMQKAIRVIRKPEVASLANEKVMVDFESGNYFMLKGVGGDIWELISDGVTGEMIVDKLMEAYDVSEPLCSQETQAFLEKLRALKFIDY